MTRPDVVIAIDAGTSVLKAIAFTVDGIELGAVRTPNVLSHPAPDRVEQDMASTWDRCLGLVKRLLDEGAGLRKRVLALTVTGQGDGTWLIDRHGEPTGPALTWLDGRSASVLETLQRCGTAAAIEMRTGTALNCSLQSVQLRWLAEHDPAALARATSALHCKDWLYFKLTGDVSSDRTESAFTFGEIDAEHCPEARLRSLGLDDLARLLPPVRDALSYRGQLRQKVAATLGLDRRLAVVLAPIDVVCAALGGGILDASGNFSCSILGSAGVHARIYAERPHFESAPIGYTAPLERGHSWVRYASNMAASLNIDWLCGILRQAVAAAGGDASRTSENDLHLALDRLAGAGKPASILYYPYLFPGGERAPFVNARARAQFLGLGHDTGLADMVRGVFESIGFSARGCYAKLAGPQAVEIRIGGGMARSKVLQQIFTDVVGCDTRGSTRDEGGAAGAAMVSAVNLGIYRDLRDATRDWVTPFLAPEPVKSNPHLRQAYDALYATYDVGYRSMDELWAVLAKQQIGAPQ